MQYGSSHTCENDYSRSFADLHPDEYLLMDAKNITYGGGRSKIELCDLLSIHKSLIHIKQYSGSAALSHLFNQATVSAELIKSDPAFLSLANEKIAQLSSNVGFQLSRKDELDVVFGIISNSGEERPQIPFFSKVSFRYTKQRLETYGYKVSIKRIKKR